jgi:hypothetical protein
VSNGDFSDAGLWPGAVRIADNAGTANHDYGRTHGIADPGTHPGTDHGAD